MKTRLKIPKKPDPGWPHWRLLAWSALGWDFIASFLVAVGMLLVWLAVGPFASSDLHITPVIALTAGFVAISLTMWGTLAGRLRSTDYRELIQMVDESEDELRAPYEITAAVCFVALIASGIAALLVDVLDSRVEQAIMVAVLAFFVSWAVLATISTALRTFQHDRRIAKVEAIRKATDADERTHRRTRRD